MSKNKKISIEVQGTAIAIVSQKDEDYISQTDIAKYRKRQEPFAIINNWMRGRSTIEFLGLWEKLSNPNFKPVEFDGIGMQVGLMEDLPTHGIDEHGKLRSLTIPIVQDLLTGKKRVTTLLTRVNENDNGKGVD